MFRLQMESIQESLQVASLGKVQVYEFSLAEVTQANQGRIQNFLGKGAAGLGAAVFRGRRHGRKGAFSRQKGASPGGRDAASA